MTFFNLVGGNWLWFVWAAIAVCVVVGYIRVRRHLNRVEAAPEPGAEEARKRHAAEHAKKRRRSVE